MARVADLGVLGCLTSPDLGGLGLEDAVLGNDVEADVDTLVADVDRGPGDELLDVPLALVAEGAAQNIAVAGFLRHLASGGMFNSRFAIPPRQPIPTPEI